MVRAAQGADKAPPPGISKGLAVGATVAGR
jgi:hypothetical protein